MVNKIKKEPSFTKVRIYNYIVDIIIPTAIVGRIQLQCDLE